MFVIVGIKDGNTKVFDELETLEEATALAENLQKAYPKHQLCIYEMDPA